MGDKAQGSISDFTSQDMGREVREDYARWLFKLCCFHQEFILDQGEWIKLLTAKLDRMDTWDPPCGRRVLTAKVVHRYPNRVGVYVYARVAYMHFM